MRKLLFSIFLLAAFGTQAQVCTPGTQTSTAKGYILPDSATNLLHGCPGLDYTQVMYIKAPADTTFQISLGTVTADIDSFVIATNITGLPTYLSANSVPAPLTPAGSGSPKSNMDRLVVPGDSLACVKINGTVPSATAAGTNNLNIMVRAYLSNLHSQDVTVDFLLGQMYSGRKTDTLVNLNYYKIVIDPQPCYPQSVQDMEQFGFHLYPCTPNPFNSQTRIRFECASSKKLQARITNALGQVVSEKNIHAVRGDNYITLISDGWQAGLYTCTLTDGRSRQTIKMVLQ